MVAELQRTVYSEVHINLKVPMIECRSALSMLGVPGQDGERLERSTTSCH